MSSVIITPTSIDDLRMKLQLIKAHVMYRKSLGFDVFQRDEVWNYNSLHDPHTCPVCLEFDQMHIFTGFDIPRDFPSYRWLASDGATQLVYPNVHDDHKELKGQCRCSVTWLHPVETLAERLVEELSGVVA